MLSKSNLIHVYSARELVPEPIMAREIPLLVLMTDIRIDMKRRGIRKITEAETPIFLPIPLGAVIWIAE